MKYCYKCGQEINENAKYCKHCGTEQLNSEEPVFSEENITKTYDSYDNEYRYKNERYTEREYPSERVERSNNKKPVFRIIVIGAAAFAATIAIMFLFGRGGIIGDGDRASTETAAVAGSGSQMKNKDTVEDMMNEVSVEAEIPVDAQAPKETQTEVKTSSVEEEQPVEEVPEATEISFEAEKKNDTGSTTATSEPIVSEESTDAEESTVTEEPTVTEVPASTKEAAPKDTITTTSTPAPKPTATPIPSPAVDQMSGSIEVAHGILAPETDFLFPDSSERVLTYREINSMLQNEDKQSRYLNSQMAINEIYARYGYHFHPEKSISAQEAYEKFNSLAWYEQVCSYGGYDDPSQLDSVFNEIEKTNINTIREWQTNNNATSPN